MPALRLLVLGGTGFVGSHLLPRLAADGHAITVLSRNREQHLELTVLPQVRVVSADVYDRAALARHLGKADVALNLVGILNETRGQSFRRVHVELTHTLVDACRQMGVPRLVQMSALKAGQGESKYLRTRGEAETEVKQSGLAWTLLQSAVIFGHGDGLVTRFAGLLRIAPVLPLARPHAKMAPVYVGDVVEAIARCVAAPRETAGRTFELYGPDVLTLGEIVRLIRDAMGVRRAVLGLPDALGRLQAAVAGCLPGKPFSLDNFRSLLTDSVGSVDGLAALGIAPHRFAPMLPALLHDRGRQARIEAARATLRS
ncbi:MAG: complex I NDUFA9 subunit family protein [Mizugakiibacter sp.]|uniref:complex I NDUFA9 subunit family protein n=1 Tax=Mizugakiibacter sp. TaxID=1972610 RepID=UPI0031BF76B2|nr:complex I NDUFA9 subunit family protein [Xanthomonadaceae bacterium]